MVNILKNRNIASIFFENRNKTSGFSSVEKIHLIFCILSDWFSQWNCAKTTPYVIFVQIPKVCIISGFFTKLLIWIVQPNVNSFYFVNFCIYIYIFKLETFYFTGYLFIYKGVHNIRIIVLSKKNKELQVVELSLCRCSISLTDTVNEWVTNHWFFLNHQYLSAVSAGACFSLVMKI